MTTACPHDRIDYNRGIVVCRQCHVQWEAPSGLCKRCGRAVDDPPHVGAVPCS